MANRVTVSIRNHVYPILAEEEEGYIRQCAGLVQRELDRAMEGTTLSLDDGAVLAALNLADQYYKERQVSDNLRAQLKEALDENAKLRRAKRNARTTKKTAPKQTAKEDPAPAVADPAVAAEPVPEAPGPEASAPAADRPAVLPANAPPTGETP